MSWPPAGSAAPKLKLRPRQEELAQQMYDQIDDQGHNTTCDDDGACDGGLGPARPNTGDDAWAARSSLH